MGFPVPHIFHFFLDFVKGHLWEFDFTEQTQFVFTVVAASHDIGKERKERELLMLRNFIRWIQPILSIPATHNQVSLSPLTQEGHQKY